jgi:hypothetical protein
MKALGIVVGVAGLLLGAYYGFASSRTYTTILTISIVFTAVSLGGFVVWFLKSAGVIRVLPVIGVLLASLNLLQAINRLMS